MKRRMGMILSLLLAAAMVLGACSSGEDKDLVVLTGSETGTYFPLGGALAQIINDKVDGMTATAVTSGASVVNVNDVNSGGGQLALVQNDIAFYAAEGSHMFDAAMTGFKGVATLYPEVVQIVAADDSGIRTVDDLRGKRVAVGDQGSGAEANARQVLEIHGITYDDITAEYMAFGDAANAIQDGNIDAAFITAGTPTAAIESLKATKAITIVSISDEKIAELTTTYPYYTAFDLPSSVYGTAEDAKTVAVQAMLIASNELSEDEVYRITKAMFENLSIFVNTHQRGNDISLDSAQAGMSVELHAGAKKYYDEAN